MLGRNNLTLKQARIRLKLKVRLDTRCQNQTTLGIKTEKSNRIGVLTLSVDHTEGDGIVQIQNTFT